MGLALGGGTPLEVVAPALEPSLSGLDDIGDPPVGPTRFSPPSARTSFSIVAYWADTPSGTLLDLAMVRGPLGPLLLAALAAGCYPNEYGDQRVPEPSSASVSSLLGHPN